MGSYTDIIKSPQNLNGNYVDEYQEEQPDYPALPMDYGNENSTTESDFGEDEASDDNDDEESSFDIMDVNDVPFILPV